MRVVGSVRSLFFFGLLGSHFVSALSFGGNKKKSDDSNEGSNNDNTATVRGAAKSIQRDDALPGISDLSSAVSSFFQTGGSDDSSVSEGLRDAIRETANSKELQDFLETTRRALHKDPEVMYELPHTSHKITAILEELNIDYTTGWAKNTHPDRFPGDGGIQCNLSSEAGPDLDEDGGQITGDDESHQHRNRREDTTQGHNENRISAAPNNNATQTHRHVVVGTTTTPGVRCRCRRRRWRVHATL